MMIFNQDEDKTFNSIELAFTKDEIIELRDRLNGLLESKDALDHSHFMSQEKDKTGYHKEILLVKYTEGNFEGMHERYKKIILLNE
jgi:hypothetical protein